MDSTVQDIEFDDQGNCNYCKEFIQNSSGVVFENESLKNERLNKFIKNVKIRGTGKKYDCIVGISGGVDSSMVLVHAVRLGLRPLAVHMDNGWNSELAQSNIENLVNKLGVDLHTTVIDWVEYRKLMQSFFDADVIDVELLYDNAMTAVNYQQAAKYGIRYLLSGTNKATEGMKIPPSWNWFKLDKKNIKGIARRNGIKRLNTFPSIGTKQFIWYTFVKKIIWVPFLDFTPYNKDDAIKLLTAEYDYKPYPYKHYESIFTRFYQGYILPKKFKVDKRMVHLSNLIVSDQMTHEGANEILKLPTYPSPTELISDINYFQKKMNWDDDELESYLSRPQIRHDQYPTEKAVFETLNRVYKFLKKISNRSKHVRSDGNQH